MKISTKFVKVILVILFVLGGMGIYFYLHRGEVSTDSAAIDSNIVVLSPKTQGYVKALYIQDNQLVKAGDVLLEIDPTDYIIKRDRAKATLAAAKAAARAAQSNLETTTIAAPSNTDAAQAQVAFAQANWEKAFADRKRMESLFSEDACSKQQLDGAIAAEKSTRAILEQMKASYCAVSTAPSMIATVKDTSKQLAAQVEQAEIELKQAEIDLANTKIISPIDGRITKRSVQIGNYVQIGQQLGSIVGMDLWVTANFKETQLEHMRPGQLVDIRIDAYPNIILHGKVDSQQSGTGAYFSLFPAENATGNFVKTVQRVPVKIVFDNIPDETLLLGPGMSVIPTVYTEGQGSK